MDKVSVVVIAGLIIAAVAAVTLGGDPKPATGRPRRHRAAPAHLRPAEVPDPESPRIPAFTIEPTIVDVTDEAGEDDLGADDGGADDGDLDPDEVDDAAEPGRRRAWVRLRAGALLVLTVVVLGGLAAGLLGVAVLVGYRALDGALG